MYYPPPTSQGHHPPPTKRIHQIGKRWLSRWSWTKIWIGSIFFLQQNPTTNSRNTCACDRRENLKTANSDGCTGCLVFTLKSIAKESIGCRKYWRKSLSPQIGERSFVKQLRLCFVPSAKAFFSRLAPTLICFANSVGFNTVASPLEILRWKTSSWRGKSKWFISGIYKRKVKNVVVCLFFTLYDNGVSVSEIWRPNWWSWWCFWWRSAIFDLFPSVVLLICRTSLDPHFPSKICSDKEIRKYCLRENQTFYNFSKLLQKAQQDTIRVGFVHLQLKISSSTFFG